MNETLTLALAWSAGVLLGAIFFGGLWWTVRKGVSSSSRRFGSSAACCCGWALPWLDFTLSRAALGAAAAVSARICHRAPVVTWLTRPSAA